MTNFADPESYFLESTATLVQYNKWIVDTFRPYVRGAGIEYGAGSGTISRLLLPSLRSLHLIEPNIAFADHLRSEFADEPKISVLHQSLDEHLMHATSETYDVAALVNVLEHIEDDRQALQRLRSVLVPGGHLLLFVPALGVLYSELDRLVGHHRRYGLSVLKERVREAGMSVISARYFDMLGVIPWLLIHRLAGSTRIRPWMASVYDRLFTPAGRLIESAINPCVGKNIILVARRDN